MFTEKYATDPLTQPAPHSVYEDVGIEHDSPTLRFEIELTGDGVGQQILRVRARMFSPTWRSAVDEAPYYPHGSFAAPNEVFPAVNALPEQTLWSVMERVYTTNACQCFMACRPERPKESYKIDFLVLRVPSYADVPET